MGLSLYNIKKWYLMMTGKSVLHVNQDIGKCFSVVDIRGYYNNLTEKVMMMPELLETNGLPLLRTESGEDVAFPVGIFQYGLGSYDLFLQTDENKYRKKFFQCCQWALNHQETSGAWSNFFYIYPEYPYGAMCQGEGASLLLRAYCQTKDKFYFNAAKKAIDFMLLPLEQGGTVSNDGGLFLLEYTHMPAVLNGWIFALFGLYDYIKIDANVKYQRAYQESLKTIIRMLPEFDCGYWSMYDLAGKISSPFYHDLHIAQMEALYLATNEGIFDEYATRWKDYKNRFWNPKRAFIQKAVQKIME